MSQAKGLRAIADSHNCTQYGDFEYCPEGFDPSVPDADSIIEEVLSDNTTTTVAPTLDRALDDPMVLAVAAVAAAILILAVVVAVKR